MITAVDSNVLLDVFKPDPGSAAASRAALEQALQQGGLVACDIVWAEVAGRFPSAEHVAKAMSDLGVVFTSLDARSSMSAGISWGAYMRAGGRRGRLVADFLVGAHALNQADRLLTRDRGFYRTYFRKLQIIDPATS